MVVLLLLVMMMLLLQAAQEGGRYEGLRLWYDQLGQRSVHQHVRENVQQTGGNLGLHLWHTVTQFAQTDDQGRTEPGREHRANDFLYLVRDTTLQCMPQQHNAHEHGRIDRGFALIRWILRWQHTTDQLQDTLGVRFDLLLDRNGDIAQ
uniref:Putative secreted peptide n=1 Tax=Anopheles braziliensis TaxID=58242 RepID=A0A2M3ZQA4_9DIPT